VRFRALDIEQLGEKQVVQDLYARTRAPPAPRRPHRLARVPARAWCGLTLADLLSSRRPERGRRPASTPAAGALIFDKMRECPHPLGRWARSASTAPASVLAPLVKTGCAVPCAERVEGGGSALGGLRASKRDRSRGNAEIFLDELERLEEAGEVDLAGARDKIDRRLYAQPTSSARRTRRDHDHSTAPRASKFDTVIVPGLDRLPRSGRSRSSSGVAPSRRICARADRRNRRRRRPTYQYFGTRQGSRRLSGRPPISTSPATRAKQRLHLLACAKADEDLRPKDPRSAPLLAKIWWQAREHFGEAPADAMPSGANTDPRCTASPSGRLPLCRRAPPSVKWTAPARDGRKEEIEFSWAAKRRVMSDDRASLAAAHRR